MTGKSINAFRKFVLADDRVSDVEPLVKGLLAKRRRIVCDYAANGTVLPCNRKEIKEMKSPTSCLPSDEPEINGSDKTPKQQIRNGST